MAHKLIVEGHQYRGKIISNFPKADQVGYIELKTNNQAKVAFINYGNIYDKISRYKSFSFFLMPKYLLPSGWQKKINDATVGSVAFNLTKNGSKVVGDIFDLSSRNCGTGTDNPPEETDGIKSKYKLYIDDYGDIQYVNDPKDLLKNWNYFIAPSDSSPTFYKGRLVNEIGDVITDFWEEI